MKQILLLCKCLIHPLITLFLLVYFVLTIEIVFKQHRLSEAMLNATESVQKQQISIKTTTSTFVSINTTTNISTKSNRNYETLQWIFKNLSRSDRRVYSQQGEDGILQNIFHRIGHGAKEYVEFGVETCKQCNTRFLRETYGWHGKLFDNRHSDPSINLMRVDIWIDNIVQLFERENISKRLDLLSIDTDFGCFWLTKTLFDAGYRPRVFVVEFNRNFPSQQSLAIPESAARAHGKWDESDYFGASALAFAKLMQKFGYLLVKVDNNAINLFFIQFAELNLADFSLMYWVEKISESSQIGKKLHKADFAKRPYVHVCAGKVCENSNDW